MKSDIKEAVMNCESARKYAYLSAEITSLYHEAAVKIGVSDTVLDILYVLCEQEGQCLQSEWTVDEQERYLLFTQKYRDSFKKYLHEDL